MNNEELLMNLIKKLESGEIEFCYNQDGDKITLSLTGTKDGEPIVDFGQLVKQRSSRSQFGYDVSKYDPSWNKTFKENFYQEKGLDTCWNKDCQNKIYQKENDYKKLKIPCQDKHTRMVCLNCAEMDAIDKLAKGEKDE